MKHSGPYQPRLVHEQPSLYLPNGSDATGGGIGPLWARDGGSGTVSHPAPATTYLTEMMRTRITSTAANNNELGVRCSLASCWRGNAASRGGFYFSARFLVNAIPATSIRFFAGLTASLTTGVCVSNTVLDDTVGLWCDSTDAAALSLVGRDNTTTTKNTLSTPTTLTAGVLYEFIMICNPGNQGSIVTQLVNYGTQALLWTQNISINQTTLFGPRSTIFLAPQCGLSNALNAVGGDTALDIISVYARPNHLLVPLG